MAAERETLKPKEPKPTTASFEKSAVKCFCSRTSFRPSAKVFFMKFAFLKGEILVSLPFTKTRRHMKQALFFLRERWCLQCQISKFSGKLFGSFFFFKKGFFCLRKGCRP